MNPALAALVPTVASEFLAVGRSPAAWQRLTAGVASRLECVRRAVRWLSFLSQARLRLRCGPLLGSALETATSGFRLPVAEPESLARRALRKKPRPTAVATYLPWRRERRRAAEFRHVPSLPRGELLVSREQLVKYAESWRASQRLQAGAVSQLDTYSGRFWPHAPMANATERRTAIVDLLTRRILDMLRYPVACDSSTTASTQLLMEQWSASLDGPAADYELLARHAEALVVATTRESVRMLERQPDRPDVHSLEQPPNAETQPTLQLPLGEYELRTLGDRGPDVRPFVSHHRPHFALPNQPEEDGRPAPMLRSGTAEAAAFDWNLSALSVAMKRILDEDARRHGVDV